MMSCVWMDRQKSEEVSDLQINTEEMDGEGWVSRIYSMGVITVMLGHLQLIRNSTEWG